MRRLLKPLSWLVGVAGVAAVIWYYGPANIPGMVRKVGYSGVASWAAITVVARITLTETTTAPLKALGFTLRRSDAFWIGWLRTFANQIVPAAGVAAYVHALRRKVAISWSEVAALAAPQYVLVAAALGITGLIGVLVNFEALEAPRYGLLVVYSAAVAAALLVTQGAHAVTAVLPASIAARLTTTSQALEKMARRPGLILLVIACHVAAILLRGLRLWLLFEAAGFDLDWRQALLIVSVTESSMLIQMTPGGLGIREGAVLAGAMLIGAPSEIAAGVALMDRLFIVVITTLLTPPAVVILRSGDAS